MMVLLGLCVSAMMLKSRCPEQDPYFQPSSFVQHILTSFVNIVVWVASRAFANKLNIKFWIFLIQVMA
jgi:hypothetical protein